MTRFLDTSRIRTLLDVRVPANDGTELSVDLYLPPEPGSYPVLLNRTPADNNRSGRAGISLPPAERWKAFAALGYIVAAGDVRGRGDSDGEFVPFLHEAEDGAATLAWLRALDECNGRIGLFGSGYGAFCAWAAAVADREIQGIVSISPFGAVGKGLLHRNGAVRLDWLFWMHLIGGRTVQPANVPPWPRIHRHLPLCTMDEALGRSDIRWREWLEHPKGSDPFWSSLNLADEITALEIPALHVTGWWDGQAEAARCYVEAAAKSRAPQRVIIGPWDTAATRRPQAQVGGFDFGPRSVLDMDETVIDFFDTCVKTAAPVSGTCIFVTGRNQWLECDVWPDAPDSLLKLHLASATGANTRRGDGTLSEATPAADGQDTISHNPDVPVEFQPGFASFAAGANSPEFTLDQAHITARDEALVYTSAPLKDAVTVMGAPKVSLTVRTVAPDADLYVLLSDSFPLGMRDLHLSHTAVRLATLERFIPGTPIVIELDLSAITHDFLPGHQIRLTVTPSLFPLYARNPQSGQYTTGNIAALADIELLHGPATPSLLSLPLGRNTQL